MRIVTEVNKVEIKTKIEFKDSVPHIIKYMGSKRDLVKYLVDSINEIYNGEAVCDLFAGTSVLSGAIGHNITMYSNDIQEYSSVFAKTYLGNYNWEEYPDLIDNIIRSAQVHVDNVRDLYPDLEFQYVDNITLNEFNALEQQQQELIYFEFEDVEHNLFIKNYSGTYWSFEQCLWIDALRTSAEEYSGTPVYFPILSSLMFAMAYNAQSTGHYAQYRDASNLDSMNSIIGCRNKRIVPYFERKLKELIEFTGPSELNHNISSLDYRDCLSILPKGTLVYADPPYSFVHYSRFYHALETLVKYDYPTIQYKGRYRNDRHQSPFCKRTEVVGAFTEMFEKVLERQLKLVLSYSNTGMISLDEILSIAKNTLNNKFEVYTKEVDHIHSTMGRFEDKSRDVKEYLLIAQPI
ncbi:DNA adenine methylase [Zobellia galactanivorans]|uniref:DNA adenine methylase n=1 Tax=Zobellia galactanivorans (strain DSM 12802 / CCUG 47099 / CIP 106680 / NCIMB 13871 / Dsij) TaxID=63186 RepID=UPI0026E2A00F|nr:DNA adenine methylase [Zobellia galactanivorans]MDO6808879.1 DNA adenine methylase [Zobellia galactanivorans]